MSSTILDNYFDNVEITESCWLWSGGLSTDGYGRFQIDGNREYAHRLSYAWFIGDLPPYPEVEIDHICRMTMCVNPNHLEVVLHIENCRRGDNAQRNKITCPSGHPYNLENTLFTGNQRQCRECGRQRFRKYYNQNQREYNE